MGRAQRTPRRRQGSGLSQNGKRGADRGFWRVWQGEGRARQRGCSLSRSGSRIGSRAAAGLRAHRGGGGCGDDPVSGSVEVAADAPSRAPWAGSGVGADPELWPTRRGRSWGARPSGRRRGGTGSCCLPSACWGQSHATSAPSVTQTAMVHGSRVLNPILQRRRSGPKELGQGHAVGEPELWSASTYLSISRGFSQVHWQACVVLSSGGAGPLLKVVGGGTEKRPYSILAFWLRSSGENAWHAADV